MKRIIEKLTLPVNKTGKKFYAGIGSRETPQEILDRMTEMAQSFSERGFILRSGGAVGADTAFDKGATRKEIFLPWNGFNGLWEDNSHFVVSDPEILAEAERIAAMIHPRFQNLGFAARKLHVRNVFQILGENLDTPVDYVVYWCPMDSKGNPKGGTATAVNLARKLKIPEIFVTVGEKL